MSVKPLKSTMMAPRTSWILGPRPLISSLLNVIVILAVMHRCSGYITVYHQHGWQLPIAPTLSATAAGAHYTGLAAFDPTQLEAPVPPEKDAFPTQFEIQFYNAVPPGASIPQSGCFFGFSVEMSVVNQVCKLFTPLILYLCN